ncbi:MAG TPA: ammonium transporter [Alphaproteobacteria bacterium]|nr:ammonium transporter [Alphaproteobacteria bacterium]
MQNLIKYFLLAIAVAGLGFMDPALAQEAAEAAAPAPAIDTGDTAWMLTSTALVLLMTIPGLALFYGGMVRKMNVLATVTQSFAITCLVAVLWVVFGYSLAFGNGTPFIGDMGRFMLQGMDMSAPFLLGAGMETGSVQFTIPESVFMMFQMTFAIITPALITGAFVDRMKFSSLLLFTTLWLLIVYAPIAHWVWHPMGVLWGAGVLDFAGGTVVHINAGVAGLVAAIILGKRAGYGAGGGHNFAPHNLVLSLIGASLLWVGWFGFNAGSAAAANGRAGMAMTVTMIAAAAAGLSWLFTEWSLRGKPSALGLISGSVGGLVAITPASGFVDPAGALIIGLVAGVMCYWGATWLKRVGGYDDSLDVFGVHGVGGIVGALLTGVFAMKGIGGVSGLIEGNPAQVMTQIIGIAYTIAWCALATAGILYLIKFSIGLRVEPEQERDGLDLSLHGETVL